MDRRSMIALMGAAVLAACSSPDDRGRPDKERRVDDISYGPDPQQHAELTRPNGASRGVVVVIHGGFWKSQYDLSLGRPLAASLVEQGWTAYNIEYRRVGSGGGWPETFDDVAAAIDALATVDDLDTGTVITLGHSAGGHLAVWAAGRPRLTGSSWADPAVPVTAAISQAGVLDLAAAIDADLGSGAVRRLMGGAVDERYALADPARLIPLAVPVRCVHGRSDDVVPLSQSVDYVAQATEAGADASVTEVEGDHFVVIDPSSTAWARTLEILERL
ncbi:alpha/beta hydrolase [Aeromicrobium sp. S22]|uniref:alpha/beta hydrolase family protein n=1 Tax=Aeromicrobium sp. S22 TaxID=2662029 RepID=UPI0028155201|nr:alpha/beta hydrolase [Aeromicrobium sp. S22]